MYLLRLPNSVYYTRIATPLSLRESGYPKEFKFSLLTRERKIAYLRNIEQVQLLHGLFEKAIKLLLCFVDFKAELADAINTLREAYRNQPEAQTHAPLLSRTVRKLETKGGIDSVTQPAALAPHFCFAKDARKLRARGVPLDSQPTEVSRWHFQTRFCPFL